MNRLLAVPLIGLAALSQPLHAQLPAPSPSAGVTRFSIEGQASRYQYEEPGLMKLDGAKGGIAGQVTHDGDRGVFVAGDARAAYGKVDYVSVSTGSSKDEPDYLYEIRVLAGKRFRGSNMTLSPYTGFGWRELINDSSGMVTTTGHIGYKRESSYRYLPLGFDLRQSIGSNSYLELNAEYDLLLRGVQKSHTPGETLNNTQNKGYGLRGSVLVGIGAFAFGPFANTWKIAKSNVVSCGGGGFICWEPKNETFEAGVRFRYTFQ